ncbi:hypothetical protein AGDE_04874 [Angomonas deanei]|nr:hypothetical protein AGDE_04874 [Angomonas deanei]|eukprot:EPY39055.1 hypothetical protein AGDE_04874 [Angomonas deanei]
MASIITGSDHDIGIAVRHLTAGKLVAFPTETVYGLGGNALQDDVVKKIYAVKGRPSTDPLICHVDSIEKAVDLWDNSKTEENQKTVALAQTIGKKLWPGPITIVMRANSSLPLSVTGGSGFVGARIPNHPLTLKVLGQLSFPLAGPSANTFGHVSPTTAEHVYADLASRDSELLILDGGSCEVGIESTVVKITSCTSIEVLRRGKITINEIQSSIESDVPVTIEVRDTRSKFKDANTPMDGPGQLLTHYSPGVPAQLVTPASFTLFSSAKSEDVRDCYICSGSTGEKFPLSSTVVIDFNSVLSTLKNGSCGYCDLSSTGSVTEASKRVFEALRWSEKVEGASNVIFPFLSEWLTPTQTGTPDAQMDLDLLAAVEDRLFRAASGKVASFALA